MLKRPVYFVALKTTYSERNSQISGFPNDLLVSLQPVMTTSFPPGIGMFSDIASVALGYNLDQSHMTNLSPQNDGIVSSKNIVNLG
jgi:hypothetical protein